SSERRADRRPCRAPGHDPRRPLQDAPRRPPEAAEPPGRPRARVRNGGEVNERPDLEQAVRRVLGSAEPELGCDACFDHLDRYVELELAGADAAPAVPGLRA